MRTRPLQSVIVDDAASPFVTPAELQPGEFEAFRLGTHPKYPALTFTRAMAERWIANNTAAGMPPIVIGNHDDYVAGQPVAGLRLVRNSLVAQRGHQARFVEDMVRSGVLPDVSIQTTPDNTRLDHIALLWGERPGVGGMLKTHTNFSDATPPPTTHPAFRFDDGGMAGGYADGCEAPVAVTLAPPPPDPVDVAAEIAAEDRQSFVDRVLGKVFDLAHRFRGNPTLSPTEQLQRATDAMQQGAALLSAPVTDAAAFSEEDSMKPEDLSAIAALIDTKLTPLAEQVTGLAGTVASFSAGLTATAEAAAAETAAQLATSKATRALRFSEALVSEGAVGDVPSATVFGALHLHLQGQAITFGEGDEAKTYDGADMLEAALGARNPRLSFGRLALAPPSAAPHGVRLSVEQEATTVRAIQDKYAAAGSPITTSEANLRFAQGERP